MLVKRGLRVTVASENAPRISGKAMSLHVGRRFGMLHPVCVSLSGHQNT
jgi:hypothetical protein